MSSDDTAPATDSEGYLLNTTDWSPAVAEQLARGVGLELTAEHWKFIELVREFHARTDVVPATRPLLKLARERLGSELGNSITLNLLFPDGPIRPLAKVAGLPKPTHCL